MITETNREKSRRLRGYGYSYALIARNIGISHQAVQQFCKTELIIRSKRSDWDGVEPWRREGRERVRFLVRKRDKFKCQSCGSEHKENERHFDVHHLNGLCGKKTKGYDKESDMDGLITLCHRCHYNHPDHTIQRKKELST